MARIFRNGIPNFPKDEAELERRLEEIENLINKPRDNISFVESAFQLMQDCNLITQDNINFLLDPKACRNFKPSDPNPVSKEPYNLKAVIALLKDLQKQVEDVKKEVKALYKIWQ